MAYFAGMGQDRFFVDDDGKVYNDAQKTTLLYNSIEEIPDPVNDVEVAKAEAVLAAVKKKKG